MKELGFRLTRGDGTNYNYFALNDSSKAKLNELAGACVSVTITKEEAKVSDGECDTVVK
jgi:hypothetical protein